MGLRIFRVAETADQSIQSPLYWRPTETSSPPLKALPPHYRRRLHSLRQPALTNEELRLQLQDSGMYETLIKGQLFAG
ncbi:hypothetical protein L6164_023658 [Bauhinia variegata]|uniref:Uncharacterized protein n=1 Tax=Bauhinia variegata TaxID=167791 RepID=A0ACB9MKU1_BAUVA|nr:hypothetical protein L6164_023658 [Bauhinia variegata]